MSQKQQSLQKNCMIRLQGLLLCQPKLKPKSTPKSKLKSKSKLKPTSMSVSAHCFSQKKHLICLREFRKTIGYGRFEPKTTILAKESHDPFARIAVMPAKVKASQSQPKSKPSKAIRSQLTTSSLMASELAELAAPEELLLGEVGCDHDHQEGVDQAAHDAPEW